MQEFLKTVAIHYAEKSRSESAETGLPASMPMSHYLFCFPNRRCGLFFSKYLREYFGASCLVPSITTISELFSVFSSRQVPDRTTLLFRLYSIYRQLSTRNDKEEFDQFVFWGDMLLSDFNDADKYLVDVDALFRNVKDLKEIDAEFAGFDPEVVEIIQSFWRNFRPTGCPEDAKRQSFSQTWSILAELYHLFHEDLSKDNLAYEGMLEREVIEKLKDSADDIAQLLGKKGIRKVVFVGLSAISKADRTLMFKLQMNDLAEFCWDYADPRLNTESNRTTSASFFSAKNLSDFPNEIDDSLLDEGLVPDSEREFALYAVPSAVGQTQVASKILKQLDKEILLNPLRTAVVLPDEKLLLPMLYAVPDELGTFNVTMGYGLSETPVASFVELLAALHENVRLRSDSSACTFYFKPVLALLEHNFVRSLAGAEAKELINQIKTKNLYQIPCELFSDSPFLQLLFRPLSDASSAISYLLEVLTYLLNKAQEEIEAQQKQSLEPSLFCEEETLPRFTETDHEFLYHYNRTLEILAQEVRQQTFSFTPRTLFHLVQKLISGVSVPFSGEPLQGIQIMGVLETRGMDFDNVIILSMNEGIFPAKPVNNSFVSMSLRNAFEMPTQRHRDAVYAYHFYRLISRAHRVIMIYDSRTEGMNVGEESRYVKQLRYLIGHNDLKPVTLNNDISINKGSPFSVPKTPEIMARLEQYLYPQGSRNFSASSLNDYIACPLRFYFSSIESLREEDDVSEGVDSKRFGDILHFALSKLYERAEGQRIDADLLQQYINHPEGEITRQIMLGFDKYMKVSKLEGYNLLVARILVRYAVETLRQDQKRCPFLYIKGESTLKFIYSLDPEHSVRFKCVIDRLERPWSDPDQLRVIDYKTGNSSQSSKLRFSLVDDLFTNDSKHEAFQVMFYSLMLHYATKAQLQQLGLDQLPAHITPHLFFVRDFKPSVTCQTQLTVGKNKEQHTITDFNDHRSDFEGHFQSMMRDLFNPSVPFTQCQDLRKCMICRFKSICKR